MMHIYYIIRIVFIVHLVFVAAGSPSAGCTNFQNSKFEVGSERFHYVAFDFHDQSTDPDGKSFSEKGWPELEFQTRHYGLAFPKDYYESSDQPKPLVIELPGASTPAYSDFVEGGWRAIVGRNETILAIPEGSKDATYLGLSSRADRWVSNDPKTYVWNVGGQKYQSRNQPNELKADCGPDSTQPGGYGVYASCEALGLFPTEESKGCSWCTCVDDFSFLDQLFDHLYTTVCFDITRVILSGQSTGGMLVYQLMHDHSEKFLAIVPQDGVGFNSEKFNLESWPKNDNDWVPNIVSIHGLKDDVVPYRDFLSFAWYYVSVWESLAKFASLDSCDRTQESEDSLKEKINAPTLVEGNTTVYLRENLMQEFLDYGIPNEAMNLGRFARHIIPKQSSKSIPYHERRKGDVVEYTCQKYSGCADGKLIADCTHEFKHSFFLGNVELAWSLISELRSMPTDVANKAWIPSASKADSPTENETCQEHGTSTGIILLIICLSAALVLSCVFNLNLYNMKMRIPHTYAPLNSNM